MTIKDRAELERTIFNSLRKLDVLQELVDDRDVTEIMVNGPNDIFYEKSRKNPKVQGSFFIGREAGGCDTADCGTP